MIGPFSTNVQLAFLFCYFFCLARAARRIEHQIFVYHVIVAKLRCEPFISCAFCAWPLTRLYSSYHVVSLEPSKFGNPYFLISFFSLVKRIRSLRHTSSS